MSDTRNSNNEINIIITETYESKGQDYLIPGEDELKRLLEQHPMNNQLERPIDSEVLNKIQFYNQLSCLVGNDLDDGLFRLKEPHRSRLEAEHAEEMRRVVKAEFASEVHSGRMQECHGAGNGDHGDRVFDRASNGEGGTNV